MYFNLEIFAFPKLRTPGNAKLTLLALPVLIMLQLTTALSNWPFAYLPKGFLMSACWLNDVGLLAKNF
jgi:hypothetical protein